jgi:hypothetical protein
MGIRSDNQMGSLALHVSRPNILILGNSFIGTSEIGYCLEDMLFAQNRGYVDAISIGMATVDTYSKNYEILDMISSGMYDIVFMCGFYGSSNAEALQTILNACNKGDAELVIFPAHNENDSTVSSAIGKYSGVKCLNWKKEVSDLISAGYVTIDDMCMDDSYKHSLPLAGYVGAHMIYRAIFNEMPPKLSYYGSVSSSMVNKLGDYSSTGTINLVNKGNLIYIN